MVYRRKRRVYRRRRRYVRKSKRYSRPRRGMGYSAKRFFKLREVISLQTSSATNDTFFITDLPTETTGWVRLTNIFDSYRCCAVKLKYIPYAQPPLANATTIASSAISYQYRNTPIWIIHDYNSVLSTGLEIADVLAYANVRIKQSNRPWTYYCKFRRNQPPSTADKPTAVSNRGYQSTSAPTATQTVAGLIEAPYTDTAQGLIFARLFVTYYIVFKDQRTTAG